MIIETFYEGAHTNTARARMQACADACTSTHLHRSVHVCTHADTCMCTRIRTYMQATVQVRHPPPLRAGPPPLLLPPQIAYVHRWLFIHPFLPRSCPLDSLDEQRTSSCKSSPQAASHKPCSLCSRPSNIITRLLCSLCASAIFTKQLLDSLVVACGPLARHSATACVLAGMMCVLRALSLRAVTRLEASSLLMCPKSCCICFTPRMCIWACACVCASAFACIASGCGTCGMSFVCTESG